MNRTPANDLYVAGRASTSRRNGVGYKSTLGATLFALIMVLVSSACVPRAKFWIQGITNSLSPRPPERGAKFTVKQSAGDPVVGDKIGRILAFRLEQMGFLREDHGEGDFVAEYSFEVVPAGQAFRSLVYFPPNLPMAVSRTTATPLWTKGIAVRMVDGRSGTVLWQGATFETGWCNRILNTAPDILAVMFEEFPNEVSSLRRDTRVNDPRVIEMRRLFANSTDWSCR